MQNLKRFYLAPMEGITSYVYRNAYHKYFHPLDKYFMPFIVPHINKTFNYRETKDLLPDHNQGMYAVPQILTNKSEDFIRTARQIREQFGYQEINLNLGCPSKTVVSKGRGSGFLEHTKELDRFLDEIFTQLDMKVSVKTRLGKESPTEFDVLMEIYEKYPMEELIVHPRVQADYYKNQPNLEAFLTGTQKSRQSVIYNGDINTAEDYVHITEKCPYIQGVMLGRGLLKNPGLVGELAVGQTYTKSTLRSFHDEIYEEYQKISSGDRNVLFKMKELWWYLIELFPDGEKIFKKIKKAEKLAKYETAVDELFQRPIIWENKNMH